ncbi:unnamed protein product, partial [Symbiodinium necroappetens]
KSSEELTSLQCAVKEQFPGRLYFSALGPPELLCAARSVEMVAVTVLRHTADPLGTFLAFEGACKEVCIGRLRAAVLSADWGRALLLWGALLGRGPPGTFRVKAKRSTKVGKALVSSDALAEE